MKNKENWHPGKFVYRKGKLRASRNAKIVSVSSRLMADLIARFYDRNIKLHVKGRLIDLGCGQVPLYAAYKDFVDENICVDRTVPSIYNPYIDYDQDLNEPLCFSDGSFDTIILSDVLEHVRKPESLLKEMYRILAPGGKVMLNVPFFYWIHEQPDDYFRYTEFALRSMARDSNFNIIELKAYGGIIEILTDLNAKLFCRIPLIGKPAAILIQKMTGLFIRTKMGERLSRRSSMLFPMGYTMILEKS